MIDRRQGKTVWPALRRLLPIATLAVCALTATGACAWTQTLDDGVVALQRSRTSIDANTAVAAQSARQLAELRAGIEGLGSLPPAVARMATLLGPLDRLGDLDQQLAAVARLGPSLARVGDLNAALDRVAGLTPALEAVAHLDQILGGASGLGGIRVELAKLRQPMAELSQVRDAMHDLLALRDDLRAVAGLRESMAKLGSLAEPMDRLSAGSRWLEPGVLLVLALLWGTLTMVATMLGVFLGHRIGRR